MRRLIVNVIGVLNAYGMINSMYEGNYLVGIVSGAFVLWVASDGFMKPR